MSKDQGIISIPDISDEITENNTEEKIDLVTVNYQHTIDRVIRVLKNGQEKLKTALIIPYLLSNEIELKNYTTDEQRQLLTMYCSKYLVSNDDDTLNCENLAAAKEEHNFIDYELLNVVDIFNDNQKLKEHIPDFIEKNEFSSELRNFYYDLEEFFQILSDRIKTSAEMDMKKEKYLHKIYHHNKEIEGKITEIQKELHEKETSIQWKLTEKQVLIDKYEKELTDRKKENALRIQKEMANTQEKMEQIWIEKEERIKKLDDEVKTIKLKYQNLLDENAAIEKNLREEKTKILNKLDEWIQKYNTDIGKNTEEYERLTDELNEKQTKFNEFLIEFNRQKIEFNETVIRKENEEKLKQEQCMMLFMMNRAARIIQRTWRKYLQKRKKKGKGKKMKKKK